MELASGILIGGKLAFSAAGVGAGTRLASLARREGGLGPSGLAAGMIFVGGAGLLTIAVGQQLGVTSLATIVAIAGEVAVRLGIGGLLVFVPWVFHPRRLWPVVVSAAGGVFLAATLVWDYASQTHWSLYDPALPSAVMSQLSIALPFGWGALETGNQWRRSRRQLRLGLGDPVVCHRFGLWTLACLCFVAICGLGVLAGWWQGAGDETPAALATATRGVLYLPIVVAVWLGMFAPEAYEARLRERREAASGTPETSCT